MTERNYREDFPLLKQNHTIYIDNAATAQKPRSVIEAERIFYEETNANPLRGFYPLSLDATEVYENARKEVQNFIHAESEKEIIFTRNTTESLNLVAYSYALKNLKPGDEIVVTIMEHHSNLLPWQMAASMTGATLKYLECEPDGTLTEQALTEAIHEKTKLLAVGHVSNVLGCVNPVRKMADLAHSFGAVVVVDAAQSAPHMEINVKELGADFLAFSGHKLMAPMGIGVLYGRQELLENMPPFLTGGEMIQSVSREGAVYAELPHKFEAGTVNAAGAAGLKAAIGYINSIGFDKIRELESSVTAYTFKKMQQMEGINIIGSDRAEDHSEIITFTVDDVHPHDVSEVMAADGVAVRAGHHCAQPLLSFLGCRSTVRASFAFYNTFDDADKFINSLSTVRERMGYGKQKLL